MNILLTGATGMVGSAVALQLIREGHSIVAVSRDTAVAKFSLPFPAKHLSWYEIDAGKIEAVDAVIHLAGESVFGGPWTGERRKRIMASRINSTKSLIKAFTALGVWPKIWVNASAVGYYGDCGDAVLTEDSAQGSGFLAEVCRAWEEVLSGIPDSCRVAKLRIGVVLARHGGALAKMLPPFRAGLGGRMGSGNQWMSWIHIDDLVRIVSYVINSDSLQGPINAVAPEPVINRLFTSEISRTLKRPALFPVPAAALKLAGELSTLFLSSQKVVPEKLIGSGFLFRFGNIGVALRDLLDFHSLAGVHELFVQQWIPKALEAVFPFFADEKNLERLTPKNLCFHVLGKSTSEMTSGTLIDYQLKIRGVPVKWRTEILEWQPGKKFVDTQRKGPYGQWHHTHEFEALAGGTLMTDRVLYKLPVWPFGEVGFPLVKYDVGKIFKYRQKVVRSIFSAEI